MAGRYTIEKTVPTVYLDARGTAIQGFVVILHLEDYDELHELRVPSLSPAVVSKAAEDLVNNRDKLANLGRDTSKK